MAKAKKKPEIRPMTNRELENLMRSSITQVYDYLALRTARIAKLEEAICPRVAARLTALERDRDHVGLRLRNLERMQAKLISMQAVDRQDIHIVDREINSLGVVVNDNAERSEKLAARIARLEPKNEAPIHPEVLPAISPAAQRYMNQAIDAAQHLTPRAIEILIDQFVAMTKR